MPSASDQSSSMALRVFSGCLIVKPTIDTKNTYFGNY